MRKFGLRIGLSALAIVASLAYATDAVADQLQITVTNKQPSGGFALAGLVRRP